MEHPDTRVITMAVATPVTLATLFLYCYFGKIASESYAKMADCLCECNWENLSLKHQKYFVIMIENAQRPMNYYGFGIAALDLETFTKVNE